MTQARRHKAQQKAAEATNSSGCACKLRGFVGKEDDQDITNETKLIFEWLHDRKLCGEPFLGHIRYDDLVTHGRAVPNCPMRVCRPGLLYSLECFDDFAGNISAGLQFCGLVYEGSSLSVERCLPAGGIGVLDQPVHWLLPNALLQRSRFAASRCVCRQD